MKKPSVLFFNRVYPPSRGATGRMMRDLARGFVKAGWDVTVITTGAQKAIEQDGDIKIIRVKALMRRKTVSAYALAWVKMLWAGLFHARTDLIVTMTDPPMFVVAGHIIRSVKKTAHIHWCQDLFPDLFPYLGVSFSKLLMRLFTKLSRRAMKKCDKVVTVGRCMGKRLKKEGVVASKIAIIPNWPDYELLGEERTKRASKTRKYKKGGKNIRPFDQQFKDGHEQKFRVLYSGNLGTAHPVDTIIGAAQKLAKTHPDIEFVFVGGGSNVDRLAAERARLRLENIRFLPFQPARRLNDLMQSGDIHLISMKNEVAGMLVPCKLYSALAVERPCVLIGPKECEIAQVLNDFSAGAVVPQGDAEGLADIIRQYRTDSDVWFKAYEGASKAGRLFVPDESINAWVERAQDVINNAVK
jgi:colanic acid biosynthesis glycosyl transferase WcaI